MSNEALTILTFALSVLALVLSLRDRQTVVIIKPPLRTPPSLLETKSVDLPDFVTQAPNKN